MIDSNHSADIEVEMIIYIKKRWKFHVSQFICGPTDMFFFTKMFAHVT
jgi:hypothetical protein